MPALRRPAVLVSVMTGVVLLSLSGRYGYHRDELYFIAAGRHLAWGYPDQPPLLPLLARLTSWSDSLVLLRLPSTVAAAVVVLLAGALAERLGADRRAQWMAASATALCGFVLGTGHLLSTSTFSLLGWVLITWLVVRIQQDGDRRLWLLVGLVGGLTFQANPLVAFLLVGLLVVLRSPGPLVAGTVALVIASPYLVWQARHDWPQLDVARHIAAGGSGSSVSRELFLPMLILQIGPWLLPLWLVGLKRLLHPWGVLFLGLLTVFLALGGKPYYLGGLLPLLLAAGAQPFADRVPRWGRVAVVGLSLPVVLFTLPVLPEKDAGLVVAVNPDAGETIGWPSFARQVAGRRVELDIVITWNYGQAGALERYGENRVYSGHNGYGLWEAPTGRGPAVMVGIPSSVVTATCARTVPFTVPPITSPHDLDNDENGTEIVLCELPRKPWDELWPMFRHVG